MLAKEKSTLPATYRADIDGLRAVAVISVVLYHFGFNLLQGGFVGVDIFFVISGFLITRIIAREMAAGEFTFARFYERRIRRIFPAVFAMLLIVGALAWFVLLPSDLILLGRSMLSTVLFFSNIFYWKNSGYFDTVSELNPLLHTWSLAIEEQFYFLFPALLLLFVRYIPKWIKPLLWLVVLIAFAICIWQQATRPTATFYLLPFRAWELGAGSVLALNAVPRLAHRRLREILGLLGAALVALSLLLISGGAEFPGWQALFPVLGAALILYASDGGDTVVAKVLSNRTLVFVGLISYSLYLWHWPIYVFSIYLNNLHPLEWKTIPLLGVSVFAAWLSYTFVEKPFRRPYSRGTYSIKNVFGPAAASMIGLCMLGFGLTLYDGWSSRMPEETVRLDKQRNPIVPFQMCDGDPAKKVHSVDCRLGRKEKQPTVVLWGDSHALAWTPVIDSVLSDASLGGIAMINSACPPLIDVSNSVDPYCLTDNDGVRDFVKKNKQVGVVILHASWISYSSAPGFYKIESRSGLKGNDKVFPAALNETIKELTAAGKRVILIGPTPGSSITPTEYVLNSHFGSDNRRGRSVREFKEQTKIYSEAAAAEAASESVVLIEPSTVFCDSLYCQYSKNGNMLYRDHGHINVEGADFVLDHLGAIITDAILARK